MYKIILPVVFFCVQACLSSDNRAEFQTKRVCVIGAGISGLTISKYFKEEGINFTVLEATRYVGGTWRYDPRVGTDENGLPLYTSTYKHLRTNLPKPIMELRGFPLPEHVPSYPTWKTYYEYLQDYAKHHELEKHIQFLRHVISVKRKDDVWKVKYKCVKTGEQFGEDFDYVVIGSGHHSKPNMPNIVGEKLFKGTIIHSHDYKVPDPYTGRRVLVIGAGPSAMDMGIDVAYVSRSLFHSHHNPVSYKTPFPPHYVIKPDVKEFNETGVVFVDGTYEEIDDVIYCTGFLYSYPFLDETTGLTLDLHSVVPLYKYLVNINQPTMFVMGAIDRIGLVIGLDAQARYTTALIKGNFTLPSRDVMMQEWQRRVDSVLAKGLPLTRIHHIDDMEAEYYMGMSEESGIHGVAPVMIKIREEDNNAKINNMYTFRNYEYIIIDDNTFLRRLEKNHSATV